MMMSCLNHPISISPAIHSLEDYRREILREHQETRAAYLSPTMRWSVPEGLRQKVNDNASFRPFFGDTLVFPLDDAWIASLAPLQELLHSHVDLATPLVPSTFHVTLHDLLNGNDEAMLKLNMNRNAKRVREILNTLSESPIPIRFEVADVLPCLNISIVMSFLPVSEIDYRRLMNLHRVFDELVRLPYFLRPHITLAYFRPASFSDVERLNLMTALQAMSSWRGKILELDGASLAYQWFTSMNHYDMVFGDK